jgi:hypothetical protein
MKVIDSYFPFFLILRPLCKVILNLQKMQQVESHLS